MTRSSASEGLHRVARHLPFQLDETDRVGEAFARWRDGKDATGERTVDLWTYCFVRRYFLVKFAREPAYGIADLDELVERVYRKVQTHRHTVERAERYASWVSVICKNTFLNYLRRRRRQVSVDAEGGPVLKDEPADVHHDAPLVRQALLAAIARLPPSLQTVARLKFVEDRPYEDIAAETERPVASVRAYVHKAIERFRKDERLLAYLDPPDVGAGEP